VNAHNYHITLKFFGNTESERISQIEKVFDEIQPRHNAFTMKVANTGTFSRKGMPKILWFDTLENEPLYRLAEDIENSIVKLGYNREDRPFKAHLTVGGIRYIKDKKHFNEVVERFKNEFIQDVLIDRFILFESVLKPGGPIYTEIRSWKL
jgi:2'-5' RNA ligase